MAAFARPQLGSAATSQSQITGSGDALRAARAAQPQGISTAVVAPMERIHSLTRSAPCLQDGFGHCIM